MAKPNIHPQLHQVAIECACGQVYQTQSTRPSYKVDICSNCHPFYTGKAKLLDVEGRIDRFYRKYKRT
jgi:large subunit ribosomal protein L31